MIWYSTLPGNRENISFSQPGRGPLLLSRCFSDTFSAGNLKKPNGDAWTFIVFCEWTWKVWYVSFCVSKMGFNDILVTFVTLHPKQVMFSRETKTHRSCVVGPRFNRVENTVFLCDGGNLDAWCTLDDFRHIEVWLARRDVSAVKTGPLVA